MASSKNDYREIKERSLEVCRDFTRNRCNRSDLECRFAHPPSYVEVRDGRVIVCFDYTKNRCKRASPPCKYFHPPDHLLNEGPSSGRRSDDYYSGSSKVSTGEGGGGGGFGSVDSYFSGSYGLPPYLANALGNCKAAFDAMPWVTSQQRSSSVRVGGSGNGGSFDSRSDKIEVCREFKRGRCNREECRYAHPPDSIKVGYDNYVTYCMDFVNGRCSRDSCRYFHPPPHLMDRMNRAGSVSYWLSALLFLDGVTDMNTRTFADMNRKAFADMNRETFADMNRKVFADMNRKTFADMNRKTFADMNRKTFADINMFSFNVLSELLYNGLF